jgi:hypothetical protein
MADPRSYFYANNGAMCAIDSRGRFYVYGNNYQG